MDDQKWQPGIVVLGHQEVKERLHADRLKLLNKKVMVREGTKGVAPEWVREGFCLGVRTFVVQGYPHLWFCEHEILTD